MTTWPGYIATTDIDQDSPVTQPLMVTYRDQIESIAQADSSVPAELLPTVLLATLTTTSGASQTASSLDLTPFKFLKVVWSNVSHNSASNQTFSLAGIIVTASISGATPQFGMQTLDLVNGDGMSVMGAANTAGAHTIGLNTTITNATTSITIATSGGSFDLGEVNIYGVK